MPSRPLAVVTGASSGIGFALAQQFATHGFDLLAVAEDVGKLNAAAERLRADGGEVRTCSTDLSTLEGVGAVRDAVGDRPVAALAANAGVALGQAFLDQNWPDILRLIRTDVVGSMALLHGLGHGMRERGQGRILITSSIAAAIPGAYQAVYNASKAFLQSFGWALRNELKDTGVSVTMLMPGATDTDVFRRAGDETTLIARAPIKASPADVAKTGFDALMKGQGDVVHGLENKLLVAAAAVTPSTVLAQANRMAFKPHPPKD